MPSLGPFTSLNRYSTIWPTWMIPRISKLMLSGRTRDQVKRYCIRYAANLSARYAANLSAANHLILASPPKSVSTLRPLPLPQLLPLQPMSLLSCRELRWWSGLLLRFSGPMHVEISAPSNLLSLQTVAGHLCYLPPHWMSLLMENGQVQERVRHLLIILKNFWAREGDRTQTSVPLWPLCILHKSIYVISNHEKHNKTRLRYNPCQSSTMRGITRMQKHVCFYDLALKQ